MIEIDNDPAFSLGYHTQWHCNRCNQEVPNERHFSDGSVLRSTNRVGVDEGTAYASAAVVKCSGRWTNEAPRDAGLHLPLAPTVGFLVFTPPVATSLNRVVRSTVIHTRPDGAGRLMLHWTPTDATLN